MNQPGTEAALQFLSDLFPEIPAGLSLPVWCKNGKRTLWCESVEEAASLADREAKYSDVYFGASLQDKVAAIADAVRRNEGKPLGPSSVRGVSATAGAVGGLWIDIDVIGPGHKSTRLPPDEAAALSLLEQIPLRPTWIVRTGGGIQAWWMLVELWTFDSGDERERAAATVRGWVGAWQRHGEAKGWDVDPTSDLARVLRVPGTFNRKPEMKTPRPVTAEKVGPRYNPSDFEPFLAEVREVVQCGPLDAPQDISELADRVSVVTLKYLTFGGRPNSRNNDLYAAATDIAGCGMERERIEAVLTERAKKDGLDGEEIAATIRSAWGKPRSPSRPPDDDEIGSAPQHARRLVEKSARGNGRPPAAGPAPTASGQIARGATPGRGDDGRIRISNVVDGTLRDSDGNDNPCRYHIPLPEIHRAVSEATGNWPRIAGGMLFAVTDIPDVMIPDKGCVRWLAGADELIAWLGDKCDVRWSTQDAVHNISKKKLSPPSKKEMFAYLMQKATPVYRAVEILPHYPQVDGLYYMPCHLPPVSIPENNMPTPLGQLIEWLNPETENDRLLLMAALLTPGWGGPPGARPAFVFTSDHGRGVGKTATATALAEIWGGCVTIGAREDWDKVRSRLLADSSLAQRIVLIDNIKGRLHGSDIESMITATVIDGWKPYHGQASRPNLLTWYFTSNSPSLSSDLADRSVIIKLGQQKHGFNFIERVAEHVRQHRAEIIAELMASLSGQKCCSIDKANRDRWGSWQDAILTLFEDGNELAKLIIERRPAVNADLETAESIAVAVREMVEVDCNYPENHPNPIRITRDQLHQKLISAGIIDKGTSIRATTTIVKDQLNSGPLKFLEYQKRKDKKITDRFWFYYGEKSDRTSSEFDTLVFGGGAVAQGVAQQK